MRQFWIFLMVVFCSCAMDKKENFVTDSELAQSSGMIEAELDSRFDCYKQLFIDSDSSFDSFHPKGQSQLFCINFLKLKNSRDSIINIKAMLTKEDWMRILFQF